MKTRKVFLSATTGNDRQDREIMTIVMDEVNAEVGAD
jgi:hypothetical protein